MINSRKHYTKIQSLVAGLFFAICMPLAFIGFQKTQNIELRPALDVLFFLILVVSILKTDRLSVRKVQVHLVISLFVSSFYITHTIARTGLEVHTLPTLKVFFYVIFLLTIFISRSVISELNINRIINIFLILATVKYITSIILGLNYRPIFWTENNFEVLFFIIIFLYYHYLNNNRWQKYISLLLVLLSGSASGAISLIFSVIVLQVKKNLIAFFGILIITGIFTILILLPKFSSGLENIDRYAYLMSGFTTLSDRSYFEILFGPGFAKPLSAESCMQLSYIKSKVSENFTCYSNILSIGMIRYIIDFGIFGTGYFIYITYRLLRLSGYTNIFTVSVLIAIILNGISVSGFSNQFAIFALFVLLLKCKHQKCVK